ncbi:hypothetical protein ACEPAH_9107 [Sanghuangporus vaninii]
MADLNLALSFQTKEHRVSRVTSDPTTFASWGLEDLETDVDIDESSRKPLWGALVGCLDGSIFVFRPDFSKVARRKQTLPKRRFSGSSETAHMPSRVPHHLALTRSRNASPTGSRTNLAVTSSKSRAVSGLSKEQVEAPKNYVDFDDEQERMKGMISERAVKEKRDRSPRTSLAPPPYYESAARRLDDTRSIASIESSSTLLSPPTSPTLGPSNIGFHQKRLSLRMRVIPRDFGPEHSIVSLSILEDELFVSLQKSGKVSLFKCLDGSCVVSAEPGPVPLAFKSLVTSQGTGSQALWRWCLMYTTRVNDVVLVVAIGEASDRSVAPDSAESHNLARIVVYELTDANEYEFGGAAISKIGDFVFEGCAEGFTISPDTSSRKHTLMLYQIDSESVLTARVLALLPRPIVTQLTESAQHNFSNSQRIELLGAREVGKLPLTGKTRCLSIKHIGKVCLGLTWSTDELLAYTVHDDGVTMRSMIPLQSSLRRAEWINENDVELVFLDRVDRYSLPDSAINESTESVEGKPVHTTTILRSSVPLLGRTLVCSTQDRCQHVPALTLNDGKQQIALLPRTTSDGTIQEKWSSLWSSPSLNEAQASISRRITSVLPMELASIIIGYNDGYIIRTSIDNLVCPKDDTSSSPSGSINCAVLSLFSFKNIRTGQHLVVGGGDDGSVNFWALDTLKLQARWILFTEPLAQIVYLEEESTGRLRGCCLCISGDGTIAVIAADSLTSMHLIPGSPAPLQTICLGSDNLVLFYSDHRTRLWDVKTGELRRSMTSEKAAEMLAHGNWFISDIDDRYSGVFGTSLLTLNRSSPQGDPPPMFVLDVGSMLDRTKSSKEMNPSTVKALLALLHTAGLDEHTDRLMSGIASGTGKSSIAAGLFDHISFQTFFFDPNQEIWQISPEITAIRLLIIVTLLNALSTAEAYAELAYQIAANSTLSFYTVSLPSVIGLAYQAPSLATLAYYWNESAGDVRSAAKLLFENEITRLSDDSISTVAERWRHKLPCILPEDQRQTAKAALALSICGNIAIERYALLSSTTLSDVAKSVMIYFNDAASPHRVLAIDLCSRGFGIWQQYFDSMEALRSLFVLATTSRKDSISTKNPGPYARMAILHIASSNSPLFMTTLSLDILHPRSLEYSKSVLQIIAFLIRKKPLVLYPNLPRLMEAVVKSLDPGQNAEREAVLDNVTEIIALVVQTFPTLDFHTGSQRLAVGTNEGAVIMYDLKTATRLYVLEGHRKRLTGISFSPDGRRMVTLSVEESVLLVWKVGSSFTSFFHPGAPPRQGRSGSEPYKTLSFVLQNNVGLTVEESLKLVSFSWPSDRSVRVHIRDAVFTFST